MPDLFVGRKIAYLRRKFGLSQEELAEQIHVTATTISRIENDKEIMRIDTMMGICSAFGTTPNELFGYDSNGQEKMEFIKVRLAEIMEIADTFDFGEKRHKIERDSYEAGQDRQTVSFVLSASESKNGTVRK